MTLLSEVSRARHIYRQAGVTKQIPKYTRLGMLWCTSEFCMHGGCARACTTRWFTLCSLTFSKNYCCLPVESEEGILDLFKLVPLKPGHLGIMTVPVVVAIACLCVLITCTKKMVQGVADLTAAICDQ